MARKTDDWINSFLEYTSLSESPALYREWVAVSVVASALQRKCFLRWGTLTFYPNMYVVLVGPSGARKGTAMGPGARMIRDLGINIAAEAITREALIRELKESTDMFYDSNNELVTHASLTVYSEELTVFLGYHNLQLISDITDWYDCREYWTYRTKNMGTDEIIGVWVNLIGATTPALIQNALPQDAVGGGLTARIIFVYEEGKEKDQPTPFLTTKMVQIEKDLKHDLEDIYTIRGMFRVSEEFVKAWVTWYSNQKLSPSLQDPKFDGYTSRRAAHAMKLCMILAASEDSVDVNGDPFITDKILGRAIDLLRRTEVKMPRTFTGFGQANLAGVTSRIMAYIANKHPSEVSKADLMQNYYADVGSSRALDDIVLVLLDMGFIDERIDGHTTYYKYNPKNKLGGQFR